jgi:PleD family two-component response regulator
VRSWQNPSSTSKLARIIDVSLLADRIQARMASPKTVLVLNPNNQLLQKDEEALRQNGFEVVSVNTPLQARFEIEMGRCGVFLTCYLTPVAIYRSLAELFKRYCPGGLVIFITQSDEDHVPFADVSVRLHGYASIVDIIRAKMLENKAS